MKTEDLEKLINRYGDMTMSLNKLKKDSDTLKEQIKSVMKEDQLTTAKTDYWKVTYQVRNSESLDEEKVIQILENHPEKDSIVKYRPYVDEDALENAIYNGLLDSDILRQLQKCKKTKQTVALLIKEN